MDASVNAGVIAHLQDLARRMDEPGAKRGELIESTAQHYGWSKQKVYRWLKEKIGWDSERSTRNDKGTTKQCEEALKDLCALKKQSVRNNGKVTMHTPDAVEILSANDRKFDVSDSHLNKLMKDRGMSVAQQKQPRAYQAQRSLYPNHVHMVDPSVSLLYYDPKGNQRFIRDDENYKNKQDNLEQLKELKVWRYVLVDHYSHTIMVRYYVSRGETQENMYDFLLWCWKKKENIPFHGVPEVLCWDKGSANIAHGIQNALKSLTVKAITHEAGNPRAKGSVEKANDLVETKFESRLKPEPVTCVEELNVAAEHWMNAYNSGSLKNSKLNRPNMDECARYELWQRVGARKLRLLPDEQVCRYLLSAKQVERKVRADLTITFKHPNANNSMLYNVAGIPNVYPRVTVRVSPLIYGDAEVLLHVEHYDGEETEHVLQPVEYDQLSGFRTDAAIIGEEMKSQPDTIIEQAGKAADEAAYPGKSQEEIKKLQAKNAVPFNGTIDAHSHLANTSMPSYMQRPGSELDVPNRLHVEVKPLSYVEAAKLVMAQLSRSLTPEENRLMRESYPDGIPPDELDTLCELIRTGRSLTKAGLQLVK